jgi:hypothetical protein
MGFPHWKLGLTHIFVVVVALFVLGDFFGGAGGELNAGPCAC